MGISFYISVVSPYCSFKVTEVFPRWFRAQKAYRERGRGGAGGEREREREREKGKTRRELYSLYDLALEVT